MLVPKHVDRVFSLLGALLPYANKHFDFFDDEELEIISQEWSPEGDDAICDLLDVVWESPDVIDEFARRNPAGLSEQDAALVASWRDALTTGAIFVGIENNRELYLAGDRLIAILRSDDTPQPPALIRLTFLPYGEAIVEDYHSTILPQAILEAAAFDLDEEVERARARGVIETGEQLAAYAHQQRAEREEADLERLMAEASLESRRRAGEDISPDGFHRGPLAGLSRTERERLIYEKLDETMGFSPKNNPLERVASKAEPGTLLADCLASLTKPQLTQLARSMGAKGYSSLRKAELAAHLAQELVDGVGDAGSALGTLCATLPSVFIEQIRDMALGENIRRLTVAEALEMRPLPTPHPPLTFLFKQDDGYLFVLPDDVKRDLAETLDFDVALDRERGIENAVNAACEAVTAYGIISLEDAYAELELLDLDISSFEEFHQRVLLEAAYDVGPFALWQRGGTLYLAHWMLMDLDETPEDIGTSVVDDTIRETMEHFDTASLNLDDEAAREEIASFMKERLFESMAAHEDRMRESDDALEQDRLYLLDRQRERIRKHLYEFRKDGDILTALRELPEAEALEAYLNERIPDGQPDYFFADATVEDVILAIVLRNAGAMELLEIACDRGLEGCDEDPQRLLGLLSNLRNALPHWELNGWSPNEAFEADTGRKMFMDDRGLPRKIGRNDPCPCGSGKKYKKCCGR